MVWMGQKQVWMKLVWMKQEWMKQEWMKQEQGSPLHVFE